MIGLKQVKLIGLLLALALVVAGCVSVPTAGPVLPGGTPGPAEPNNVEIAPEPPAPGASRITIVEGYLHAMASYRTGYDVARQYLTEDAQSRWRPEDGVQIYADGYPMVDSGTSVKLRAPQVGTVSADGAYRTSTASIDTDFGLVQVDGEWRINTPPPGLLIPEYLFKRFYQRINLYFFDPSHSTLVPDPIYLPTGNQNATTVIRRLLGGPTDWLAPVVVTAIPQGTELNVAAPVDSAGVVEVSLSENITRLDEDGRSRMAAQLAWTLSQLSPTITGVRILNNGQAYAIRGQNEDGVVPVDSFAGLDPIPTSQRADLYAGDNVGIGKVSDTDGEVRLVPLAGPAGSIGPVQGLAVNLQGDQVAMVTDDRTRLSVAPTTDGALTEVLTGTDVGRPQYTRFNELWVRAEVDGKQQVLVHHDGHTQTVEMGQIGDIQRIRVSPDGLRAIGIRASADGGDDLMIGRITRTDRILIDGWQTLPYPSTQSGGVRLIDVGWTGPTTMMVLVAEGADVPAKPYRLDQAGATWQLVGQPDNWNAVRLATAPSRIDPRVVMLASDGTAWRYEDDFRWPRLMEGLLAIAYPG